jgi:hypothetical protein
MTRDIDLQSHVTSPENCSQQRHFAAFDSFIHSVDKCTIVHMKPNENRASEQCMKKKSNPTWMSIQRWRFAL